jgi:hypothetical protein
MSSQSRRLPYDLGGHTALVSGANHGIGAATAKALAACGASVLLTYFRTPDPDDFPEPYRTNRVKTAEAVVEAIRAGGGRATSMEADLRDPAVVPQPSMLRSVNSATSIFWSTTPRAGSPIPSPHTGSTSRVSLRNPSHLPPMIRSLMLMLAAEDS